MEKSKKLNWIDEDIVIDFKLPKFVAMVVDEIEKYDSEGNDIMYMHKCDRLENMTKEYVLDGIISSGQRELLIKKYH